SVPRASTARTTPGRAGNRSAPVPRWFRTRRRAGKACGAASWLHPPLQHRLPRPLVRVAHDAANPAPILVLAHANGLVTAEALGVQPLPANLRLALLLAFVG